MYTALADAANRAITLYPVNDMTQLQFNDRLSVVIPSWNAADLVLAALDHLQQSGTPQWSELIVVDDGVDRRNGRPCLQRLTLSKMPGPG